MARSLLIFDCRGKRDPLQWEFYKYLSNYYTISISSDCTTPLKDQALALQRLPDYIFFGFQLRRDYLDQQSVEWLNASGIPVIVTVGDLRLFIGKVEYTKAFWRLKNIMFIVVKWRKEIPMQAWEEQLRSFMSRGWVPAAMTRDEYGSAPETFLRGAEIIYNPWGIGNRE
jgi:hypothetical protein